MSHAVEESDFYSDPDDEVEWGDHVTYKVDSVTGKPYVEVAVSREDTAEFHCNYCKKPIQEERFKCIICVDFDLCATCFHAEVKIDSHDPAHPSLRVLLNAEKEASRSSYRPHILLDGSLFWDTQEELMLLEGICLHLFNWDAISRHLGNQFSASECSKHFNDVWGGRPCSGCLDTSPLAEVWGRPKWSPESRSEKIPVTTADRAEMNCNFSSLVAFEQDIADLEFPENCTAEDIQTILSTIRNYSKMYQGLSPGARRAYHDQDEDRFDENAAKRRKTQVGISTRRMTRTQDPGDTWMPMARSNSGHSGQKAADVACSLDQPSPTPTLVETHRLLRHTEPDGALVAPTSEHVQAKEPSPVEPAGLHRSRVDSVATLTPMAALASDSEHMTARAALSLDMLSPTETLTGTCRPSSDSDPSTAPVAHPSELMQVKKSNPEKPVTHEPHDDCHDEGWSRLELLQKPFGKLCTPLLQLGGPDRQSTKKGKAHIVEEILKLREERQLPGPDNDRHDENWSGHNLLKRSYKELCGMLLQLGGPDRRRANMAKSRVVDSILKLRAARPPPSLDHVEAASHRESKPHVETAAAQEGTPFQIVPSQLPDLQASSMESLPFEPMDEEVVFPRAARDDGLMKKNEAVLTPATNGEQAYCSGEVQELDDENWSRERLLKATSIELRALVRELGGPAKLAKQANRLVVEEILKLRAEQQLPTLNDETTDGKYTHDSLLRKDQYELYKIVRLLGPRIGNATRAKLIQTILERQEAASQAESDSRRMEVEATPSRLPDLQHPSMEVVPFVPMEVEEAVPCAARNDALWVKSEGVGSLESNWEQQFCSGEVQGVSVRKYSYDSLMKKTKYQLERILCGLGPPLRHATRSRLIHTILKRQGAVSQPEGSAESSAEWSAAHDSVTPQLLPSRHCNLQVPSMEPLIPTEEKDALPCKAGDDHDGLQQKSEEVWTPEPNHQQQDCSGENQGRSSIKYSHGSLLKKNQFQLYKILRRLGRRIGLACRVSLIDRILEIQSSDQLHISMKSAAPRTTQIDPSHPPEGPHLESPPDTVLPPSITSTPPAVPGATFEGVSPKMDMSAVSSLSGITGKHLYNADRTSTPLIERIPSLQPTTMAAALELMPPHSVSDPSSPATPSGSRSSRFQSQRNSLNLKISPMAVPIEPEDINGLKTIPPPILDTRLVERHPSSQPVPFTALLREMPHDPRSDPPSPAIPSRSGSSTHENRLDGSSSPDANGASATGVSPEQPIQAKFSPAPLTTAVLGSAIPTERSAAHSEENRLSGRMSSAAEHLSSTASFLDSYFKDSASPLSDRTGDHLDGRNSPATEVVPANGSSPELPVQPKISPASFEKRPPNREEPPSDILFKVPFASAGRWARNRHGNHVSPAANPVAVPIASENLKALAVIPAPVPETKPRSATASGDTETRGSWRTQSTPAENLLQSAAAVTSETEDGLPQRSTKIELDSSRQPLNKSPAARATPAPSHGSLPVSARPMSVREATLEANRNRGSCYTYGKTAHPVVELHPSSPERCSASASDRSCPRGSQGEMAISRGSCKILAECAPIATAATDATHHSALQHSRQAARLEATAERSHEVVREQSPESRRPCEDPLVTADFLKRFRPIKWTLSDVHRAASSMFRLLRKVSTAFRKETVYWRCRMRSFTDSKYYVQNAELTSVDRTVFLLAAERCWEAFGSRLGHFGLDAGWFEELLDHFRFAESWYPKMQVQGFRPRPYFKRSREIEVLYRNRDRIAVMKKQQKDEEKRRKYAHVLPSPTANIFDPKYPEWCSWTAKECRRQDWAGCGRTLQYTAILDAKRRAVFDCSRRRKMRALQTKKSPEGDEAAAKNLDRSNFDEMPEDKWDRIAFVRRKLRLVKSELHHLGVITTQPIPAGFPVVEYKGELISAHEADRREKHYRRMGQGDYMFAIDGENKVVDATKKGNIARFINHSCQPNCFSHTTMDPSGIKHIVIFALQDIQPGEELSYDYQFGPDEDQVDCLCGAPNCRGSLNTPA